MFKRLFIVSYLVSVITVTGLTVTAMASVDLGDFSVHDQATVVTQYHDSFPAAYLGPLSLSPDPEIKTSLTSTIFFGMNAWSGGQIYFDPELTSGSGFSGTTGMAGFPNGEIYRVDSPDAKVAVSRIYVQQYWGYGGEKEKIADGKNQVATEQDVNRLTIVLGRFSLADFFDGNSYSHDPRTQFLNWSIMDNGAWDYAADTRGYTWGAYVEYNDKRWSIRVAHVMVPKVANQMDLETDLTLAYSDNVEWEYRYGLSSNESSQVDASQPQQKPASGKEDTSSSVQNQGGVLRLMYYSNRAHMGSYSDAVALNPVAPDITATREYRTKWGLGANLEQPLSSALGLFSRAGWNDGTTETWAFTEIDDTFQAGLSCSGTLWHRDFDVAGLAVVTNGLSAEHKAYLAAGGHGFMIGDGALNYARENIAEVYYLYKPIELVGITADYQFVSHPAYNQDRGPVSVFGIRGHYEF